MKKKLSERAKMRIRIAKDVLLQLKERKLKPAHLYADFSGKKKHRRFETRNRSSTPFQRKKLSSMS